jgi:hypothetical protein
MAWLLIPALLLDGCGEPNGFEAGCQSQVSFVVSAGLTPQIGWSPDCKIGVLAISVYPGMSGTPGQRVSALWMIRTRDRFGPANLLRPTVRYGEPPSGATALQDPEPLVAGTQYVVQGWVFDLEGQMVGAGTTAFRP